MSGCEIFGTVENSVLSSDVIVKKGAVVKNSIIMADVVVGENAVVNYAIIDENTKLGKGAKVGEDLGKKKKITLLGRNINVYDGANVPAGQIVDQDVKKEEK